MKLSVKAEGPFHAHERHVQHMFHVADQALDLGNAMVDDRINPSAIPFLQSQPFILLSFVDIASSASTMANDSPAWVTIVHGDRGFFRISPDGSSATIERGRIHASDNLIDILSKGGLSSIPMAIMVIDFEYRRRFRINGSGRDFHLLSSTSSSSSSSSQVEVSFRLQVQEAYGNCPKYIQARRLVPLPAQSQTNSLPQIKPTKKDTSEPPIAFTASQIHLIQRCDTFFLSSYYSDHSTNGVKTDITHRGGNAGFIRIVNDATLLWPEYAGNNMFMTLGNIHGNKKVGLTLLDFEHGNTRLLKLSGDATLLTSLPPSFPLNTSKPEGLDGCQRFVLFTVKEKVLDIAQALPFAFQLLQSSPYNPPVTPTPSFTSATTASSKTNSKTNSSPIKKPTSSLSLLLVEVIAVCADVASFRFKLPAADQCRPYLPGQYVMIRWKIGGRLSFEGIRSWTLTSLPHTTSEGVGVQGDDTLQITIKRAGVVTSWLFEEFVDTMGGIGSTGAKGTGEELMVAERWVELIRSGEVQCELVDIAGDFTIFATPSITGYELRRDLSSSQLLFFSGGIGMTPFLGMIKGLCSHRKSLRVRVNITWFMSVRKIEEVNALLALASYLPSNTPSSPSNVRIGIILSVTDPKARGEYFTETLNQHYRLTGGPLTIKHIHFGRLSEEVIRVHERDIGEAKEVFVCGPADFMRVVESAVPHILPSDHRIHKEDFYF